MDESELNRQFWQEMVSQHHANFYFDPSENMFVIGANRIPITETKDPEDRFEPFSRDEVSDADPEQSYMVLDGFGTIVTLPRFNKWISGVAADESRLKLIEQKSRVIMRDVAKLTQSDLSDILLDLNSEPPYSMGIYFDTEDGAFSAYIYGNCACLGPTSQGVFNLNGRSIDEPYTYVTHNVDMPAQAYGLYAAAGYLAWEAARDLG